MYVLGYVVGIELAAVWNISWAKYSIESVYAPICQSYTELHIEGRQETFEVPRVNNAFRYGCNARKSRIKQW
jgi:hypothetical protein